MEKVAYSLKDTFIKIKNIFNSPKFLKIYDKVIKFAKIYGPKIIIISILIIFSYIFMSPILRVFIDSLKNKEDLANPDVVWIPSTLTFKNYMDAAKGLWLWRPYDFDGAIVSTLWNSTIYSFLSAVLQTIVACTTGYAFARFNFKGKKLWFFGLILAFILPVHLLTLPRKLMLNPLMNAASDPTTLLGIPNSYKGGAFIDSFFSVITAVAPLLLTMLGQGINSSILIFIAFSFFKMIPVALDEAAQIDGANFLQIFWNIILKMSIPTILVVFLFSFIWNWNDTYITQSLIASNVSNNYSFQTLPESLSKFAYRVSQGGQMSGIEIAEGETGQNAGLRSAAIIMSIAPLLILYAFTQRKFVEGIENTGVTGV